MTKTKTKAIDLADLHSTRLNMRRIQTGEIDTLAASILRDGLLQCPVVAKRDGGGFQVIIGSRRIAAIRKLAEAGKWVGPVDCQIADGDDMDMLAMSVAENTERLPAHGLDQLRVFRSLVTSGYTPAKIGKRFGMTTTAVKETLALAGLAGVIRKAYVAGEIEDTTAKAFATTKNTAIQLTVWRSLPAYYKDEPLRIRREIQRQTDAGGKVMRATHPLFRYIGADAYQDAGGKLQHDLFTPENEARVDADNVRELALAKLHSDADAWRAQLAEDGWKHSDRHDIRAALVGPETYVGLVDYDDVERERGEGLEAAHPPIWFVGVGEWSAAFDFDGPFMAEEAAAEWLGERVETEAEPAEGGEIEPDPDAGEDEIKPLSQPRLQELTQVANAAVAGAVMDDYDIAFDLMLASLLSTALGMYGRSECTVLRSTDIAARDLPDWLEAIKDGARAAACWFDVVQALDAETKQDCLRFIVSHNVQVWTIDHMHKLMPAPMPSAVSVAEAARLDVGETWDGEARRLFLERGSKAELIAGPLMAERPDIDADAAMKDAKADVVEAAVEASLNANWLPPYLAVLHKADAETVEALAIAAE